MFMCTHKHMCLCVHIDKRLLVYTQTHVEVSAERFRKRGFDMEVSTQRFRRRGFGAEVSAQRFRRGDFGVEVLAVVASTADA